MAALTRLIDGWYDQERSGRATLILLALFVALWTSFQIISYASLDLHPDLVEVYVWGRHPAAGYAKHPPLAGLITAAWFAVFPAQDWAFHLLAMINAAAGLFFVDLIARRYLSGDKRLLVLLLLLLTPFYQFHGQRFSTNQVLLSTWPLATYCFLRAFESRAWTWSLLAGVAAALAMLGKYYSIYLVGSFVIAALAHPQRWAYLKSASPWLSIGAGLFALAPHLYWLATQGLQPLQYATATHGDTSFAQLIWKDWLYLVGACAYVALPFVVYLLAVRPSLTTLKETVWPPQPDHRILVILLASQVLLPFATAPFLGVTLTPLWTMSAWFLLPIVLLAPDSAVLPRLQARRTALLVLGITLAVLIAAPAIAWRNHVQGNKEHRAFARLAAQALDRAWREAVGTRLKIVFGDIVFAGGATFYLPQHPDAVAFFSLAAAPWVTADDLRRYGWAVVCLAVDDSCVRMADAQLAQYTGAKRVEADIVDRYLGHVGATQRFVFVLVPPGVASAGTPK